MESHLERLFPVLGDELSHRTGHARYLLGLLVAIACILTLAACGSQIPREFNTTTDEAGRGQEHLVPSNVGVVDGRRYNGGIEPGDIITLVGSTRGPIKFRELRGTARKPIIIRNDPDASAPIVIDGGGKTFVFLLKHSEHIVINGGASRTVAYGIQLTSSTPGVVAFLKIKDRSRFITVQSVEIDGKRRANGDFNGRIGIDINDHQILKADYPGYWNEGHRFLENYLHDLGTEGLYLGPNDFDVELNPRDIEAAYNLVERVGRECINVKGATGGTNLVHHNICVAAGLGRPARRIETDGITTNNSTIRIFNNWVEKSMGAGIHAWRKPGYRDLFVEIFNNIVVDAGSGPDNPHPWAISVTGDSAVYNNTIVAFDYDQGDLAVYAQRGTGSIHDNLIAGYGASPIRNVGLRITNNWIGSINGAGFVDASGKNFHLTKTSPARDGGSPSGYPPTDYDDAPRGADGHADIGALEF